jgi:hypothetical protein
LLSPLLYQQVTGEKMEPKTSTSVVKSPAPKEYKSITDSGAHNTILGSGWKIIAGHNLSTRCQGYFGGKLWLPMVDATTLLLNGIMGKPIGLLVCYDAHYHKEAKKESLISTCQMEHSNIEVNAKN